MNEVKGKRSFGRNIKAEDIILDDCPVPAFQYKRNSTFYKLDQQEQLREYLKKRVRELGSI